MPCSEASKKLSKHLDYDCGYETLSYIDEVYVFNLTDLVKGAGHIDADNTSVKLLTLTTGAKSYEWYGDRTKFGATSASVTNSQGLRHTHTFTFRTSGYQADTLIQFKALASLNPVVIVARHRDKAKDSAFEFRVWGYEQGLELTGQDFDANAEAGSTLLTLTTNTDAGGGESTTFKTFNPTLTGSESVRDVVRKGLAT